MGVFRRLGIYWYGMVFGYFSRLCKQDSTTPFNRLGCFVWNESWIFRASFAAMHQKMILRRIRTHKSRNEAVLYRRPQVESLKTWCETETKTKNRDHLKPRPRRAPRPRPRLEIHRDRDFSETGLVSGLFTRPRPRLPTLELR